MDFWWGLVIGLFAGTNLGVVVAGLLAGAKRDERSQEHMWGRPQGDQTVMDKAPVEKLQDTHPPALVTTGPALPR